MKLTEDSFVITPHIKNILDRAQTYLEAGFPVHFSGPSGTGKTSLALYLAEKLGRPIVSINGNDDYNSSDLIGGNVGYDKDSVVDNYVHSIMKFKETYRNKWIDGKLTSACRNGFTLIYDEFNRSRPETNNILLSILEEKFLDIPDLQSEYGYIKVHPDFRAIFTSNPEEYAGVHKTQDSLRDRFITIDLDYYDKDTEVAIVKNKSGLKLNETVKIVDLVRKLRESKDLGHKPSVRASIKIAIIAKIKKIPVLPKNENFEQIVNDVILSELIRVKPVDGKKAPKDIIRSAISKTTGEEEVKS